MQWIEKAGRNVVYLLLGGIMLYLFLCSIYSTCVIWYDTEQTFYITDFPLVLVSGLFVLVIVLFFVRNILRKLVTHRNMIILTLLWLFLLAFFVVHSDIELVYDQRVVYEGTVSFIQGDFDLWDIDGYFSWYPFQNGLVLLYAPLVLLFGEEAYWAVQIVNIVFYFGLACGSYRLVSRIFGHSTAEFTYLAVLFYFPLWGYVKYWYGNLPGLSLAVWAVYFATAFLEEQNWKDSVACTICIGIAILYKSNFMIYAVAIGLVLVIELCKKRTMRHLCFIGLLIIGMYLGMNGASIVMAQITGNPVNQGIPMIHWVSMGLSESYVAPGWYSGDTGKTFSDVGYSVENMKQLSIEKIMESVSVFRSEKEYALRFFGRKLASIWNNPTFECFAIVVKGNLHGTLEYWMKDILYSGGIINTVLTLLLDVEQSVILFGSILYLFFSYKRKRLKHEILLVAFLGGFIFHIFWEAKCQYTIIYFVLLIPYAIEGYKKCIQNFMEWQEGNSESKPHKIKLVCSICVIFLAIVVIRFWNNTIFSSTIKLQGEEDAYVWLCREQDYWRDDNFTKEGER